MSIVRVNLPQAELLHTEYEHLATAVDDAISDLSPLIAQAHAILDQTSSPIYGPIPALQTTINGLREDRDDLDWRLDYIERSEHTISSLDTLSGYTPNLRPDSYLTQTEQDRIHHNNLTTFRQLEAQSWTDTNTDPEPEPIPHTIYGHTSTTPSAYTQHLHNQAEASIDRRIELGHGLRTEGPSASTIGHVALDVGGMFPVIGNAADGIHVAWYTAEQDYLNAALSSLAAIPAIGQAITAAKPLILTAATGLVFRSLDEALAWARRWLDEAGILGRRTDETVDFGATAPPPLFSQQVSRSNADALANGTTVPFTEASARNIAEQAGVGLEGVSIQLLSSADEIRYLDSNGAGAFASNGTIYLGPAVFDDPELLARTIGHERTHIFQQGIGIDDPSRLAALEEAAYQSEQQYIDYFRQNP